MGGIWRKIPVTYAVMWIGSLALAGIPIFAGYYSKDAILEAAWARHSGLGTIRLLVRHHRRLPHRILLLAADHPHLPRHPPRRCQHTMDHVHESPAVMLVPLILLAAGAVLTGFAFEADFIGHAWQEFWREAIVNRPENHVLEAMHHVPTIVSLLPTIVGVLGIGLAYLMYVAAPALPARLANAVPGLYRFVLNKWYFDELYDRIVVAPGELAGPHAVARRRHRPDRWHPERHRRAHGGRQPPGGPHADRLDRHLRLHHADRPRAARQRLPALPVT